MVDRPNLLGSQMDESPQRPDCFILKMPLEVLSQVIDEVKPQMGGGALLSLARTCRALNAAVMVRLYAHICDGIPSNPRVLDLHRTLYSSRDLGKLVQTMVFRSARLEAVHALNRDFRDYPHYPLALSQLFGLDPAQPKSLQEPVNIMMMACLAPNISRLDLTTTPQWRDTDFLLNFNNGRMTGPRITLGNLTLLNVHELHRANTQPGAGMNLHKLNGLLHAAPNLRLLGITRARSGTSLTCRLPHLTTLILLESLLCARGFRHLLRGCHGLITLVITHDGSSRVTGRFTPISAPQILECLTPSKVTLQNLVLWPWVPDAGDPREAEYAFLPGQLGDFPALKQLSIHYKVLGRQFHDDKALVELLSGLDQLEVLLVMVAHFVSAPTFTALADAVIGLEWPRLRPSSSGRVAIGRERRR